MEGRIVFYAYGNSIELNGDLFVAGELTADLLNLSGEDYQPLDQQYQQILELAEKCRLGRNRAVWWELNNRLEDLSHALRKYRVFQIILEEDDALFSETRSYTERYSLFPEDDTDWIDRVPLEKLAAMSMPYESDEAREARQLLGLGPEYGFETEAERRQEQEENLFDPHTWNAPDPFLICFGNRSEKWRCYEEVIDRYGNYLGDISVFNPTIHNFIRFMLSDLETNSPESYAAALYEFYNNPRLAEKLIPGPSPDLDIYSRYDECAVSYVPREKPGGGFVISQEHVTDSLQGLLKADFMQALNHGHNIRQCLICKRYFLIRTGAHALYCEGASPMDPRFTCRQYGSTTVQKELARDVPKIRAKLTAFERITKDQRREIITREEARKAKDRVRDLLYDALRDSGTSLEEFEKKITPKELYSSCEITRKTKPRGRPRKAKDGDAP